jgi:hypothetical protein
MQPLPAATGPVGSDGASIFWDLFVLSIAITTGFSESSMFPARQWSIAPNALKEEFHFDERASVTHLLLTNGIVDGWSLSSILQSEAPGVTVVNMVNGAHHSDLDHHGSTPNKESPCIIEFVGKLLVQLLRGKSESRQTWRNCYPDDVGKTLGISGMLPVFCK